MKCVKCQAPISIWYSVALCDKCLERQIIINLDESEQTSATAK